MKSVALVCVIGFLALVGDCAFADAGSLSAKDNAVLTAVLLHFSKSHHSAQYNPRGYIGIAPATRALSDAWTDDDYLKHRAKLNPPGPQSAVTSYVSRNRQSYRLADFPQLGAVVRVDAAERQFDLGPDFKGPLRTYVHLRVPGYSADGQWAYVSFDYLWSIHGAYATYLLKLIDGGWVVMATDFSYAV